MFDYLFPIFAFGLVVTGIVFKGVLAANDVAKADRVAKEGSRFTPFEMQADFPASVQPVVKHQPYENEQRPTDSVPA